MNMLRAIQAGCEAAIKADPRPLGVPYNHPLTRRDEADMCALINAVLCGGDITNIGGERGPKIVTADEVLVSDPYGTRYETEAV